MTSRRFTVLVDEWLASIVSNNTRSAYQRDLVVFADWADDEHVNPMNATAADIVRFRDHLGHSGAGAATVNRRLAAVTSFYRHAAPTAGGKVMANPGAGTSRLEAGSRSATALSSTDSAEVWRAALRAGGRSAVIVGLVLLEGYKTKDMLLLDVEHVDLRGARLSVAGVPVRALTAAAIRSHVGRRRTGPLLLNETPGRQPARLSRFGVDFLVKRVGVDAGLSTPLTVNDMRATHRGGQSNRS